MFRERNTHLVHILAATVYTSNSVETRWNYGGHDTFTSTSENGRRNYILQRIYMPIVSEIIYYRIGRLSRNVVYIWMSGVYYLIILQRRLFILFQDWNAVSMFTTIGLVLFGHFFVYISIYEQYPKRALSYKSQSEGEFLHYLQTPFATISCSGFKSRFFLQIPNFIVRTVLYHDQLITTSNQP